MVIRQIPKERWCAICDTYFAEVEISHEGSLRPFWFNPEDGELCLCRECFGKLKQMVNEFTFEKEN